MKQRNLGVSIVAEGKLIDTMYNLDCDCACIYIFGNKIAVICEEGTFVVDNYDKAVAKLNRRGYRF